ncbi:hypothetical protein Pan161_58860 [Gimesia algae]|uniref:Uncharacterized protein n=2 Tax=Gimesia algae TaxID=2527971 RepID=A0A517VME6_9PLAN|nr:hypothetical protein Pan161_58860 [Gimesia algae]
MQDRVVEYHKTGDSSHDFWLGHITACNHQAGGVPSSYIIRNPLHAADLGEPQDYPPVCMLNFDTGFSEAEILAIIIDRFEKRHAASIDDIPGEIVEKARDLLSTLKAHGETGVLP